MSEESQQHNEGTPEEHSQPVHSSSAEHSEPDMHADAPHGGGDGHHDHPDLGPVLPLWSCVPFACMLLSIALFPLVAPEFWHHHFGKVSAFWAATMAVPFLIVYKGTALYEIIHIILADYVPFIILLWSLYTVSGGILLRGSLRGTPIVNVTILALGTILASWMGTTGAAMLLIRPFLRANNYRKTGPSWWYSLSSWWPRRWIADTLGRSALFLGFLHGVSFFWTLHILPHMLTVVAILLIVYFFLDLYHFRKETGRVPTDEAEKTPLKLVGIHNFIFLAGIVGAVLMSGMIDWGHVNTFGVHRGIQDWVRDGLLILMGLLSMATTSVEIREGNDFTWFPIIEVAYLFVGIFITMIPCLLILKAGASGQLAFLINAVKAPVHYFWVTGALSGFLDNAPTYLTFFNTALGSHFPGMAEAQAVPLLMTDKILYLEAISAVPSSSGPAAISATPPTSCSVHCRRSRHCHAQFFWIYSKIHDRIFIAFIVVVTLIFF